MKSRKTYLSPLEAAGIWPGATGGPSDRSDPLKTVSGAPSPNPARTLEQAIGLQADWLIASAAEFGVVSMLGD